VPYGEGGDGSCSLRAACLLMGALARVRYPTKAAVRRAVNSARACGIDVAAIEVSPDGTVRVLPLAAIERKPFGDTTWDDL
jgi:hypothetical protein